MTAAKQSGTNVLIDQVLAIAESIGLRRPGTTEETPGVDADNLEPVNRVAKDLPTPVNFDVPHVLGRKPLVFVEKLPTHCPPNVAQSLKELFERRLVAFEGIVDGIVVSRDSDGVSASLPPPDDLAIRVRECGENHVQRLLEYWVITHDKVLDGNGLELLVVQPSAEHAGVYRAWSIKDVLPRNTCNNRIGFNAADAVSWENEITVPLYWRSMDCSSAIQDRAEVLLQERYAATSQPTE